MDIFEEELAEFFDEIDWPDYGFGDALFKKNIHIFRNEIKNGHILSLEELGSASEAKDMALDRIEKRKYQTEYEEWIGDVYDTILKLTKDYKQRIEEEERNHVKTNEAKDQADSGKEAADLITKSKKIESIYFKAVPSKGFEGRSHFEFVVNGDFSDIRNGVNKEEGNWRELYLIAKDGSRKYESSKRAENVRTYFNSREENQLYSAKQQSGYQKTSILRLRVKDKVLLPKIILKVLSGKQWSDEIEKATK